MNISNQSATNRPARRKKSIRQHKKSQSRLRIVIAIIVAMAICVVMADIVLLSGSAPTSALIKIPKNATKAQLSDSISRYLGDGYARKVVRLIALRGTDLSSRHGAYLIEAGWSPLTAMRRLTGGPQHPVTITINGFRIPDVLQKKVAAKFDFTSDSIAEVMADATIMKEYGLTPEESMALFLNDSYEFYWNASPESVVRKIGCHYLDVWDSGRRAKAESLGLTPAEVMTLASIVDEETNAKEEKGKIGRLYINRLKIGMPLQADPTVRFAGGDFSIKRVTGAMTRVDHPYNTYMHKGLPPGPIRTTSVETIDAILDSTPHDFLYMCAKEDFSGRHSFARTFAEHQVNARRYKRELDRRGIH